MANINGRSPYNYLILYVILLLLLTVAMATRPLKTGSTQTSKEDSSLVFFQEGALKADQLEDFQLSCEGLEEEEEEECLNRRALAAHTDYIYTQHHKHP